MARTPKKSRASAATENSGGFSLFDEPETSETDVDEEELPKDEAGRAKIKQQYVELLGIRIEKLKGRILNREPKRATNPMNTMVAPAAAAPKAPEM